MIITEKHKMRDYARLSCVINLDKEFINKVKALKVPAMIGKVKLTNRKQIQLQYIIQGWNVDDENMLIKLTANAYGLNEAKVDTYPMLDFIRLTIAFKDVLEEAADLFNKLSRKSKKSKIQAILEKYSYQSNVQMIDRFVKRSNGAYTHDQAAETSWYVVYEAFKADTAAYDIDVDINEMNEMEYKTK